MFCNFSFKAIPNFWEGVIVGVWKDKLLQKAFISPSSCPSNTSLPVSFENNFVQNQGSLPRFDACKSD